MSGLAGRLVREPLLHFLVIGAVLFLLLGKGAPAPANAEIVVSKEDISRLAAGFQSTWQRPPTADELKGAIADDIRAEVLYRSGTELGLDKGDTIVRRRIAQKMQFLLEGTVEAPAEDELRHYLAANAARFRTDPVVAFRQVFISSKRDNALGDAGALLPQLASAGPNASLTGDPSLLPETFGPASMRDVASRFGDQFAQEISKAKQGFWVGPLTSAYGIHLVLLTAITPEGAPTLQEARAAVEREWYAERRKAVVDANYAELRARYVVRVAGEAPTP